MSLSILNRTRRQTPRLEFEDIKDKVLGKSYELSLVFCGSTLSKRLNRLYRGKDYAANVLSFPLTKNSGEIFIDLSRSARFGVPKLFIHGLLHLKGWEHSDRMDAMENKLLAQFAKPLHGSSHRSRNRHRHLTGQSRHRRRTS